MHVFRLVHPYPDMQARLTRLLTDVHAHPTRRRLIRLHNQSYAVQRHAHAEWGVPEEVVLRGLTNSYVLLTDPFHEYMQTQIEALFDTKRSITQPPSSPTHPLTFCNAVHTTLPKLSITIVYSTIIIQGIGSGELIDSDRHFEDLMQCLVDLRTDLRVALLMALHPRLGANALLSCVGEDVLRHLC